MLNHQALVLTVDEHGGFGKALNIHTNINYLIKSNCNTISLIGLKNYPSFTDIKVYFNENQFTAFTTREIEIIKLLAQGHSTIDISGRFNISEHSVKAYLKNIHKKSACRDTAELIHKFIAQGVI